MFGLTDVVGRVTSRAASYAALLAVMAFAGTTIASADTRSLRIYHLHTHEKEEIVYKRNGRYVPDGLKKMNWILRDWRKAQPVNMDPRLLDLIWEAYRQSGSRAYINVVCGYRSASTNGMLRSRTGGVAKESQHMLGKAMDFYIPDVSLAKLRAIGLKMQIGGVGYYPRSGSPFVHFDVGNVRHWPRMSRKELLAVFPNGNTVHVPSDGKPLPGYEQALASYKSRKSAGSIQIANAGATSASSSSSGGKTLLAMLFGGGGADEEEDVAEETAPRQQAPAAVRPSVKTLAPTARDPKASNSETVAVAALVPAKRDVLPSGVPLPIRDTFDTSAPRNPTPSADLVEARKDAPLEVAALDIVRIPVPSAAPAREINPVVAAQIAEVPVPSRRATTSAEDDSTTLLTALESAPAMVEAPAGASGQLAYAVPMPRVRPPFEAVLKQASLRSDTSIDEIRRIVDEAEAAETVVVPHAAPVLAAANHASELTRYKPADRVILASLEAPARIGRQHKIAVPEGKTTRFKRGSGAVASTPTVTIDQGAINDRITLANLVTDLNKRTEVRNMDQPKAGQTVRDLPTSVMAAGFAQGANPRVSTGFVGSAVHFLPVVKLD